MEEKVDIVALGELLIDFTEAGHSIMVSSFKTLQETFLNESDIL